MGDCDTEQAIYWIFVCLSLLLTFGVAIYRRKQRNFVDNPAHGRKCYLTVGIVKIIVGILLLTVLYPVDCMGFESFYGAVAMMIGIYWLVLACMLNGSGSLGIIDTSPATAVSSEMPPMKATSTKEIV